MQAEYEHGQCDVNIQGALDAGDIDFAWRAWSNALDSTFRHVLAVNGVDVANEQRHGTPVLERAREKRVESVVRQDDGLATVCSHGACRLVKQVNRL
eukprot:11049350-Alexandrium_andersonii.AAC.1